MHLLKQAEEDGQDANNIRQKTQSSRPTNDVHGNATKLSIGIPSRIAPHEPKSHTETFDAGNLALKRGQGAASP